MKNGKITVTHINVRTSISLLLFKLIFVELLAATGITVFHTAIFAYEGTVQMPLDFFNLTVVAFLLLLKSSVLVYLILEWLNEYYEITLAIIFHRRGVIFKTEKKFPLAGIASLYIRQGIFGKLFNFGTISLYDQRRNKHDDMYLIHNPIRYAKIIESLLPQAEEEKHTLRTRLYEQSDFDDED